MSCTGFMAATGGFKDKNTPSAREHAAPQTMNSWFFHTLENKESDTSCVPISTDLSISVALCCHVKSMCVCLFGHIKVKPCSSAVET